MTPDINTAQITPPAQITLAAQITLDSDVQWLYVPCVCACVQ